METGRPLKLKECLYSIQDVSEVARKTLKNIVSQGKAPVPPVYEEEFYQQAEALGLNDLVLRLMASLPAGQVANLLINGLEKMVREIDSDLEAYGQDLSKHTSAIEKGRGRLLDTNGSHVEQVKITLDDIIRANLQMTAQLNSTRAKLREREEQVKSLRLKSRIDPLTGTFNRGAMEEDLTLEFARSKRYKRPFSIVMADIDFFKKVNDTYGHAVGDDVLRSFTRLIKKGIRESDTLYRYGGEEFLILLRETELGPAGVVAERLRRGIEGHVLKSKDDGRVEIRITASFGVAAWRDSDSTYMDIIDRADKALYCAKQSGRNQVVSSN